MNSVSYDILTQRIKRLGNLPAFPSILRTLTDALSRQANEINVDQVVEEISYDKSLTAQCLRLANSALFRQRGDVSTVREAVFSLGLWRIRDLAFSCSLPLLFANAGTRINKEDLLRHALGTAMVSSGIGQQLRAGNKEQIYLCGLLHDIGLLVNALLFPEDFKYVLEEAFRGNAALEDVEQHVLGFTHAESGRILAELWKLPLEIAEAIEYHHHPGKLASRNENAVLVHVADQICQRFGLGYGYEISGAAVDWLQPLWATLGRWIPQAANYPPEQYLSLVDQQVASAHALVDAIFSPAPVK
ncbi:MAG TPA: HDOD domain-containing protein [Candidatus Acidoferrum sp.]